MLIRKHIFEVCVLASMTYFYHVISEDLHEIMSAGGYSNAILSWPIKISIS